VSGSPPVLKIGLDFFAAPVCGPGPAVVVHDEGCTRAPCRCFGITAGVTEVDETFLLLRLRAAGEVVGSARLLMLSGVLVLVTAGSYRASTTQDWALHHQVVSELLLREAARVADERGCALATSIEEPRVLLEELGFVPVGSMLRREARS
jgi:hypothetical protein